MAEKVVDLVAWKNGERVVIGTAVVNIDDAYVDITAKVTHPDYIPKVSSEFHGSLSLGPFNG